MTLSSVFMESFPFLIFAILNCPVHISESIKEKQMELQRRQSEIVQSARTVTLLQVITELLPVLMFAIISLSVPYFLTCFTLSLR